MRQISTIWAVLLLRLIGSSIAFKNANQTELLAHEVSGGVAFTRRVPITIVRWAASGGAVCLDGSPPAYHWDRGWGSGARNWLVNLEGGGWCHNKRECIMRKKTRRGSSYYMQKEIAFRGILSNSAKENPHFYSWNRVKIRYCDGASFVGDRKDKVRKLQFRGQRIYRAIMKELMSKGMRNAKQALLSGCSAGGLATILHCDEFREAFPRKTKVKLMPGYLLMRNYLNSVIYSIQKVDVAGGHTLRNYFHSVVNLQGVRKNLPRTCKRHIDATSCFFPENLISNITTPLFLLNAAYDSWQIFQSLAPHSADPRGIWTDCKYNYTRCSASQIKFLQGFRNHMIAAVREFSLSSRNGLFINSCFSHCQSERQDTWFSKNSPILGKKGIAQSVGDWYFDRATCKAIDCAYPCDKTCHNIIFRRKKTA